MTPRGKGRAQALRLAQQAKSRRDAERDQRESLIEAALADFYQVAASAEEIRARARAKADAVLTAADRHAAACDTAARDAVRRLRDLLGATAEVAALCGITVPKAREYLTASGPAPEPATGIMPAASTGAVARHPVSESVATDDTTAADPEVTASVDTEGDDDAS
jgi:hypothetical protein